MDQQRFDAALRAFGRGASRRQAIAGALGALLGGALPAAAKRRGNGGAGASAGAGVDTKGRKPAAAGPCGDGSAKANKCGKNSECCTKYCAEGGCRCKPNWMACTKADQCCSGKCLSGLCDGGCKPEGMKCEEQFNCCTGMICSNGVCTVSSKAKCAKSNCSGCCDGTTCRIGGDKTACGSKGGVCAKCSAGQTCSAGVCVAPPACGPATCPNGCCLNGVCTPSTSATCGTGGAACVNCTGATQGCNAGVCVNCTVCSSGCPYTTVGDAVTAAADGATVWVAGGIQSDISTTMVSNKNLTIEACDPSDIPQIINGDWRIEVDTGTAAVTIRNIDLSQPNTQYVIAAQGAGLTLSLESVRIHDIVTDWAAAKMYNGVNATFLDCTIEDNQTPYSGAGLYIRSNAVVVFDGDSVIRNNSATKACDASYDSYGAGGGLAVDGGTLTLKGNTLVTGNSAACTGGGVVLYSGTVNLQGNASITGNTAACVGGLFVNDNNNTSVVGIVNGATAANITGNTETGGSCSCSNYSPDNGATCPFS